MNALQLLRQMHADTKVRFKVILAAEDATIAAAEWRALQPLLELHEQLEDQFVYTPAAEQSGPGTPLGDWSIQHDADVFVVQELVQSVDQADPATPDWRMSVGRVMDALAKHVMDEEGQIFGRIEQLWGPERLARVGAEMEKAKQQRVPTKREAGRARRKAAPAARRQ
jgi:Hemerythrin HHE cation binding domain